MRTHHPYWYLTDAALAALDATIRENPRRSWNPLHDTPSLSTLRGRAARYRAQYMRSRARLFDDAGVVFWTRGARGGARIGFLCTSAEYFRSDRPRRLLHGLVRSHPGVRLPIPTLPGVRA